MNSNQLHTEFLKEVEYISNYTKALPADLLLKLYAYYKIANKNFNDPGSSMPLINAFKANALIQAKDINRQEAMKKYIKLVRNQIKKST
ncbi:MAG: acyl-CoA-binding protein [Flavobacteriaceae bacterium]